MRVEIDHRSWVVSSRERAARGRLSAAVRDGRRERDAGQLLGRRRVPRPGGRDRRGVAPAWQGAAIVDTGGESTRPGSESVSAEESSAGVEPALSALGGIPAPWTSAAAVAGRALELGAVLVNDVTALRGDPELAGAVADSDAYLCLMHMLGELRTMQNDLATRRGLRGGGVPGGAAWLRRPGRHRRGANLPRSRDRLRQDDGPQPRAPARLGEIAALGGLRSSAPRGSDLGRILGEADALTGPVSAGVAVNVLAFERGASIFRVHDVPENVEALAAARGSRWW